MSGCPHWPGCGCGTQSGPHTCEWERSRAELSEAQNAATKRIRKHIMEDIFAAFERVQKTPDGVLLGPVLITATAGRAATAFAAAMAAGTGIPRQDFLQGCKRDFDEAHAATLRRQR